MIQKSTSNLAVTLRRFVTRVLSVRPFAMLEFSVRVFECWDGKFIQQQEHENNIIIIGTTRGLVTNPSILVATNPIAAL